ncbi:MAG: hypothetical protein ACI81P_001347, partial [Neolewinella sp.]
LPLQVARSLTLPLQVAGCRVAYAPVAGCSYRTRQLAPLVQAILLKMVSKKLG